MTTPARNYSINDIDITPQAVYDLIDQDWRQYKRPRSFSELETIWYLHHKAHIDPTLLNSLLLELQDQGRVINAQEISGKLVHVPASARMVDLQLRCWWTSTGRKIMGGTR